MFKYFNKKSVLAFVLLFALVLSLGGCRKLGNDMYSSNTSDISSTVWGLVDIVENESSDAESVIDSASLTENTSSVNSSSGSVTSGNNSGSSTNSSDTSAIQQPTTTNPSGEEIIGAGSKSQPYLEVWNDPSKTITTVSIPAGKVIYYGIDRVGGTQFTINNANAYVVYNGTTYDAVDGKVSFRVGNSIAGEYVEFKIGNKGSAATSFEIVFSYPLGSSFENPIVIDNIEKEITTTIESDNQLGCFYVYTAKQDGTLRLYSSGAICYMDITTIKTMVADGETLEIPVVKNTSEDLKSDKSGNYIELSVTKGCEIEITVSGIAKTDSKNNVVGIDPGTTVWYGSWQ